MTDWTSPRRVGRLPRLMVMAGLLIAAGTSGYFLSRAWLPTPEPGAAAVATSAAPAAAWTPTLPPHANPVRAVGSWSPPQPGPDAGPEAVTSSGVPYRYTHSDAGALVAAANAVIAGEWVTHTLVESWQTLGFLAAAADPDPQRRRDVASFLGGTEPTAAGPVDTQSRPSSTPMSLDAGCGCGFAVLGAAAAGQQPGADQGYRTVDVLAVWLSTRPAPTVVIGVDEVLLHWEDDWRLADIARQPPAFPTSTAALPAGLPLPTPAWIAQP